MSRSTQQALWCGCGEARFNSRGLCPACDRRRRLSQEKFGGEREAALARDGGRCIVCADGWKPIVHHRTPGRHRARLFSTLCRRHHLQVHLLPRLRYGLSPILVELWLEQHRGQPLQLELKLVRASDVLPAPAYQPPLFEAA